jgi:radical SAM protein with 4Fe4S-binding SPASM domain
MRQLRADEGGRPWVVQPELVTGCSMSHGKGLGGLCHFCGIQAIRSGPGHYQYMSMEIAERVASQIAEFCPHCRVEFALRGEPLIHPGHLEIISLFRLIAPKTSLMLTTNGDVLRGKMQNRLEKIFDAGLNLLLLDTYYPEPRRTQLRDEAFALKDMTVIDFFEQWAGHGLSPYSNHAKDHRLVVVMDDLEAMDKKHSSRLVKTHAGSNPTKDHTIGFPLPWSCGRPFRELIVHADGKVPLCCDDWKQEFIIGDVMTSTFEELWKHPKMEAARLRLYNKDRSVGICSKCDAPPAPRFGLLPYYGDL